MSFYLTFLWAAAFFFIIWSRLSAVISVDDAEDEADVDVVLELELEAPMPERPAPAKNATVVGGAQFYEIFLHLEGIFKKAL